MNSSLPSNQAAAGTGDTEGRPNPLKKDSSLDGNDNSSKMEIRDRETVGKELHDAIA